VNLYDLRVEHRERSDAPGRETLTGTVRLFAAEALAFPTGLVTAAVLTRWLQAEGYGVFSLAALTTAWFEWLIVSLLSRSTILAVRATDDWKPLATRILQLHLAAGVGAACLLALGAPLVARALAIPSLTGHLRLFALDVPLFVAAQCHRNIATGRGLYGRRARAVAARYTTRLVLILALVGLGLSVTGAILASIGASLFELLVARRYDRAPLFGRNTASIRPFLLTTLPLLASAIGLKIVHDADLFTLKALGASAAEAGFYAGARSLSLAALVFGAAFAPLLLSTLVRLVHQGETDHARDMSRDAIRLVLLLIPLGALVAGASDGIVRFVFGDAFAPAGPILSRLVFSGFGLVMITVASSALVAGGRLEVPGRIALGLSPLTILGHLWAIPRYGALGAACVSTGAMVAGALLTLYAVSRMWGVRPPLATAGRAALVALAGGLAARAWPATGAALVLQLGLYTLAVPLVFLGLGEFSRRERGLALRALLPSRD
jgi:O-antigen/teichoic acid export membrane protein